MEELEDHVDGADCIYGCGRGRGNDGGQCRWVDVSEVLCFPAGLGQGFRA